MPSRPTRLPSNLFSSGVANTPTDVDLNRPLPPPPPNAPDYDIPTLRRKPRSDDHDVSSLRHTRSFSHPFPSFFGGSKKADKKAALRAAANVFDSTDDEISTVEDRGTAQGLKPPAGNTSQKTTKEPVTGKCMTCDSIVRWPQGLKVYRCTICLTINDLEPLTETQPGTSVPATFAPSAHRKPIALSIDQTRTIIDQCLDQYLKSRLDDELPTPRTSKASPPPSPMFPGQNAMSESAFSPHPNDRTEVTINGVTPRPRITTRSPSDPQMSPRLPSRGDGSGLTSAHALHTYDPRPASIAGQLADCMNASHQDHLSSDNDFGARKEVSSAAIFRPLESYVSGCFSGCATLNSAFFTVRSQQDAKDRALSSSKSKNPVVDRLRVSNSDDEMPLSKLDAKTLLLGDVAENGSWWAGGRSSQKKPDGERRSKSPDGWRGVVSIKTPRINWADVGEWYRLVTQAGTNWKEKWDAICPGRSDEHSVRRRARWEASSLDDIDRAISEARSHAQRSLLKSTENLLKRPRRPLKHPEDCRFLLILLANPLLTSHVDPKLSNQGPASKPSPTTLQHPSPSKKHVLSGPKKPSGPGHHSGILKRVLGLIANLPNDIHQFFVSWLSRVADVYFLRVVDMVGGFVTYRLSRQHNRRRSDIVNPTDGLVPSFSEEGIRHPSQLHAALDVRPALSNSKAKDGKPKVTEYGEDWQVRAAARVMALLFMANVNHPTRKRETVSAEQRTTSHSLNYNHRANMHGQVVPISHFYNTMLDYADLVADFEVWESNRGKFSFCQYPFFLSIWAKIHILEHDARRQMEVKARQAFFDSILSHKVHSQFLVLKVRRHCLVEDSLKGVSEVVGSGSEDIKKGLRIDFVGEEGVDAGGLRKEWFLLLVREIFDPHHGLFVYDEDSQFCYFNPFCFESSEQFFLVGVLLGLAIYNSTILDVAFPPFVFKKMLASAPSAIGPIASAPRPVARYSLDDLAEYRPALARGLRQLLEFDGDVEETFCRDFVVQVDQYGESVQVPLCSGGEKKPVTNTNRREFVDLYIQYLLDVSVARQYEPFKRGFFTVCGGNALSLFRPEEIELLVRGSDEPLDVPSLRAVATYEGWPNGNQDANKQAQVIWFWEFFERATPAEQRKILSFITGSDRIPAMGATNLVIRVALLGKTRDGGHVFGRFPVARTCFNTLGLYAYPNRRSLERMLWFAVTESEGFGLR